MLHFSIIGLLLQMVFVKLSGSVDLDAMGNVRITVVKVLKKEGYLKSEEVQEAIENVDMLAYEGNFIDRTRNMHAYVLETLKNQLQHGHTALNVVCGSGYILSCMAYMVGITGYAVGMDDSLEHLDYVRNVIRQYSPALMKDGRIKLVDGELHSGVPEHGPYNAIYVAGAASSVPYSLKQQLKSGGRMLMALSDKDAKMRMVIVDKCANGSFIETEDPGVIERMKNQKIQGEFGPMHY